MNTKAISKEDTKNTYREFTPKDYIIITTIVCLSCVLGTLIEHLM